MKPILYYIFPLIAILFFSQCTLDRINGSSADLLTEADLQAATLIIGESLSANNSGVFLSVQDALAIITQTGYKPKQTNKLKAASGYDVVTDYNSSYNERSGVHTVSFRRLAENNLKEEIDTLQYIYKDSLGNFVLYPNEQRDLIQSINYLGTKEGNIRTTTKITQFNRVNEFSISPITLKAPSFPLEGIHNGSGFTRYEQPDLQSDNIYYELSLQFLNVTVLNEYPPQSRFSTFSLIGGASWKLSAWDSPKKATAKYEISGTITLEEQNTAIIRFNGSSVFKQIDVLTGKPINTTKTNS